MSKGNEQKPRNETQESDGCGRRGVRSKWEEGAVSVEETSYAIEGLLC